MVTRRKINFTQMVRDFRNLGITNSKEIRAKADAIVRILVNALYFEGTIEPPQPPEEVVAQGRQKSMLVAWTPLGEAASYRLYRSLLPEPAEFTLVGSTTETLLLDLGLEDETEYFYRVTAVSSNLLESAPSEVASNITEADDTVDDPSTPEGFEILEEDFGSVTLGWEAPPEENTGTRVERRRTDSVSSEYEVLVAATLGETFVDTTVSEGTEYDYRVFGVNSIGVLSDPSDVETVVVPTRDVTPPSVPENLTATAGFGNVALRCDVSPEVDTRGYIFGASQTPGGPYTFLPEQVTRDTRIGPLASSTEFYFVVSAIDTSGNQSDLSPEIAATTLADQSGDTTPPPVPGAIATSSDELGEITISWSPVDADDLVSYQVEVSLPPQGSNTGPFVGLTSTPSETRKTTVEDLDPRATYYYRVRSVDASGNVSAPSRVAAGAADGSDAGTGGGGIVVSDTGDPVEPGGGPIIVDGGGNTGGGDPPVGSGAGPGDLNDPNDPVTGITTGGSAGSTVHRYYDNTAEFNKQMFVSGMRSARAPRSGLNTPRAYQFNNAPQISNTSYEGNYNTTIDSGKESSLPRVGRQDNQAWALTNIDFTRWAWEGTLNGVSKWAIQTYDQPIVLTRECDFSSAKTGPTGYFNPDLPMPQPGFESSAVYPGRQEHDQYMHTLRTAIWQRNTSDFIGGHSFYIAGRAFAFQQYPPDCSLPTVAPLALVDNCHITDSNIFSGKSSNKIEIFDYGTPTLRGMAVVRNSTLVDAYDFWVYNRPGGNVVHRPLTEPKQDNYSRAAGMIGVSCFDFCENPLPLFQTGIDAGYGPLVSPGGFGDGPTPMHTFLVKNTLIHQVDAHKAMCGFEGVEDVRFEDCTIITDGTVIPWRINEQGYRADSPDQTRGVPRTETITFANCRNKGVTLLFRRMAGNSTFGRDVIVPVPDDLRGKILTYTISKTVTGAAGITVNGGTLFDPIPQDYDEVADAFDLAGAINALDPLAGITGMPADFEWDIPGVTV